MFIETLKSLGQKYLGLLQITAPVTTAVAVTNIRLAHMTGQSVAKEVGLGVADIGTCGAVTITRGILSVVKNRKAAPVPNQPAAAAEPKKEEPHLSTEQSRKVDEKSDKHVERLSNLRPETTERKAHDTCQA